MKSSTLDRELRSRIDSLVAELSNVVRIAVLEAVHDALGAELSGGPGPAPAAAPRRGPGRPRKLGGRARRAAAPRLVLRKRAGDEPARIAAALLGYLKWNDGHTLDEISDGTRIAASRLQAPIQSLLEQHAIRTEGRGRALKYFVK